MQKAAAVVKNVISTVGRNLVWPAGFVYKISPYGRNDIGSLDARLNARRLKNPFAFRLLPLTSVAAFCLLLFALSFSGCSLNPNLQGKGETYIQGEWQQDSSAVQQKLVTASQYHAKFDCDSFYVAIKNFSKVNYGSDTCMRSGHWAEYIKGTYRQRNDTLFLKGQFCNANFTLKTNTDCFRVGPYEEFFKVSKKTDSLVQLSGTSSVIPINLHLLKRTSCTQKPL